MPEVSGSLLERSRSRWCVQSGSERLRRNTAGSVFGCEQIPDDGDDLGGDHRQKGRDIGHDGIAAAVNRRPQLDHRANAVLEPKAAAKTRTLQAVLARPT